MKLSEYLPLEHIVHDLKGTTKIEIIEELLQVMKRENLIQEYEIALNDILDREGYLSTGLENGLAIPHAKTDSIDRLAIVFGGKRPSLFVKRALSVKFKGSFIPPRFFSIDEFIAYTAGKTSAL